MSYRLRVQTGDIPRPVPGPISQPYWDGCAIGELRYQRCRACGGATHTPAVVCAHCVSHDLEWVASAGRGSIFSYSVVWRPATPAFHVPYAPVLVELDEGWTMLADLIDCDLDDLAIGLRVEVVFHALDDGFVLPHFRPAP